ncbi:MAG: alpha/beta fold hydrolase [Candidatus Dormibacteraceae bacterium]
MTVNTTSLASAHIERPSFVRTTDDVSIFFRDWGTGDPIVFLSSWSLPSDSWVYQMLALSDQGLRCIGFDRRGHGRSSDPGRGFDFDTLANDIAAVLEVLDLQRVTLVGHSMGGAEIVRYITRYGSDRIAGIVLVGTTTPLLHRTADNPAGIDPDYFETFRSEELMKDLPQWIEDNLEPFTLGMVSPHIHDWIRSMILRASGKALLECNRAISSEDFTEELPKITVPTLVIHGDQDVSCPLEQTGRRTVELMPNAELRLYEGAPHGLFLSHMDRLNRDLLQFVRSLPSLP